MRKALFAILGMAAMFAACSQTVSASSNDDEEKASATDSSDSKGAGDGSSGSGSSEDVLDKDCVGESGKPWDGTTAKEFACGSGTKLSPFVILTAEQLAHLSFVVNANDKNFSGKYYKLAADIKLNDGKVIDDKGGLVGDSAKLHKWTPIGNSSVAFDGTFDGNGHTVSGMFINTTSSHNGLFGNSSGTVSNVTVDNSWVTGGSSTAGIVGYNTGSLKSITNKASITSVNGPVGGVVGKSYDSYGNVNIVDSLFNYGVIKGKTDVGGILGYIDRIKITHASNYGLVEGEKYTGGIWGGAQSTTVEVGYSVNYGKIIGQTNTGGIAGYCGHYGIGSVYSAKCGTLTNVKNKGVVQGTTYVGGIAGSFGGKASSINNSASISGTNYIGGMFGNADFSTTNSLYNTGDISGSKYVGGVIGYNQEGVTSAAYSTGKVDGDSLVGLMIGYNYNTTMADYYYLKQGDQEPFGQNNGGGVATPKTETEMKSADFAKLLGDDFVYDSGLNDGYPVLAWEKE